MRKKKDKKKIIILTTPRMSRGFFDLCEESMFRWQQEMTDRLQRGEIVWHREKEWQAEYMQNPCPQPCHDPAPYPNPQVNEGDRLSVLRMWNDFIDLEQKEISCAGCGHNIDFPSNFPKGYPQERMLCCGCTMTYMWKKGIDSMQRLITLHGYKRSDEFCRNRWSLCGKKIAQAMRIQ